jgi:hypothetical protein
LDDQRRVLGPDDPSTLETLAAIAAALAETGDHWAAVAAYRELFPDQSRVLGPNDPRTLATKNVVETEVSE